jgi:hypothetical protein
MRSAFLLILAPIKTEFVARRSLQDGPLPRDDTGKVILVVIKKLIHSRGVIFHGLKPVNITDGNKIMSADRRKKLKLNKRFDFSLRF